MSRKQRHHELPKGYTMETDVIIESGDGIRVALPYRYASRCSAVRQRLLDEKEIEPDGTVKFMNVSGAALTRVIDYCRYEWPDDSSAFDTDLIGRPEIPFQRYLLTANPSVLCELASASYYLDVKPLVDLTCRAIADNIKGKSPEEIRSTFNIVNDFTPAEEEEVRQSVMKRTLLMPVEQDPSQITTPFNTTSAQAAGMTGIPYMPPVANPSPSVAASYHVRNKLRSKLHHKQTSIQSTPTQPVEDKRSVDDLMSFIDGSGTNDKKKKKSKNKAKKSTSPALTATAQPSKATTKPSNSSATSTPSTTSTSNGSSATTNRRSSTSASTSASTSTSTSASALTSISTPASTSSTPTSSASTSTSTSTAPRPLQWDASLLQDEDDHTSHQEAERFRWLLEGMHHQPSLAGDDRLLDPSIMSNIVSYAGPLAQPDPVTNDISTQAMSLARNLAAAISALHPPTSTTAPSLSPSPPPSSITFTIEPIDGPNGKLLVGNLLHELGKIRYPDFDDSPNVESLKPYEVIPPNGVFIVAHVDTPSGEKRPGACAALRSLKLALPRRIVELKRMYTEPWTRGRGVGKALMMELEKWARSNGYEGIWLETGKRQPEAIALYYKCGYVDMEPFEEPFDVNLSVFMKKEWKLDEKTTSANEKTTSTPTFKMESPTHSHATLLIDHFHTELKQRYPDYDFTSHITSFQQNIHEMSPPHGIFMIGYVDNQPAVCGGLTPMKQALPRRVYELKRVWVEPWARGRGLARQLIHELETWATSQHYSAIWLMTGKRQPEAIALYRSCGYTEMSPWEDDADPTLTTYMRKSLDVDDDDGDTDTTQDAALQALIDAKLSGLSTWEKQQEQDGDENEDVTATVAAEAAARGDFDFLLKNAASASGSASAPAPAPSTQAPHPRPSLSESTDDPVSVTIHEHPKRASDGEIHFSGPAADAVVTNGTNGHTEDDNEMPPLEVSPLEDGTSLADTMLAGICTCLSSPSDPVPSDPLSTATIEALSAVCPWISSMSPSIRVCSTCGLIRLPPDMQNMMAPAAAAAAEQQPQVTATTVPITQTNGTHVTASTAAVQPKPTTVVATSTTVTSSPSSTTSTSSPAVAPHPITADMAGKQCPMHHRTASTVTDTNSIASTTVPSIPTPTPTPSTVSSDLTARVAQLEARVASLEQQLREETARRVVAEHTEQRLKAFEQRLMHLEMNKKKR